MAARTVALLFATLVSLNLVTPMVLLLFAFLVGVGNAETDRRRR